MARLDYTRHDPTRLIDSTRLDLTRLVSHGSAPTDSIRVEDLVDFIAMEMFAEAMNIGEVELQINNVQPYPVAAGYARNVD